MRAVRALARGGNERGEQRNLFYAKPLHSFLIRSDKVIGGLKSRPIWVFIILGNNSVNIWYLACKSFLALHWSFFGIGTESKRADTTSRNFAEEITKPTNLKKEKSNSERQETTVCHKKTVQSLQRNVLIDTHYMSTDIIGNSHCIRDTFPFYRTTVLVAPLWLPRPRVAQCSNRSTGIHWNWLRPVFALGRSWCLHILAYKSNLWSKYTSCENFFAFRGSFYCFRCMFPAIPEE